LGFPHVSDDLSAGGSGAEGERLEPLDSLLAGVLRVRYGDYVEVRWQIA
jgi:hypothetical protein